MNIVHWASDEGRYVLHFTGKSPDKSLVSEISKKFDVDVNIKAGGIHKLSANEKVGILLVDITGEEKNVKDSLAYLKENGVITEVV